jgi:hypothetical protein
MLFVPTAQIMAANAQQRHLSGARYDGPVVDGPVESDRQRWRTFTAALFPRSESRGRRLAAVRPA